MKKTVPIVLLLAALGGGGWYFFAKNPLSAAKDDEISDRFIAMAEKRDIDFTVQVSGDIAPAYQLEVKSEVGGKVKALHVEAGDTVKEGDLLVEIDDRDLLSEKQSVNTEIDGA